VVKPDLPPASVCDAEDFRYFVNLYLAGKQTINARTEMSGWLSYFSGTRDTKTTTRQAIVGIREQLSMLDKKEEHLEKKIEEELRKAKANAISNKTGKPRTGAYRRCSNAYFVNLQLQLQRCAGRRHTSSSWSNWLAHV
jgi:charged multivesicular body protein 4A/B